MWARGRYLRPGAVRRIPVGLGAGLRLEVTESASVHTFLGTAEYELAGYVRRWARPGRVCLDVGTHDAYYAMVFARLTGTAVVGFDSDPEALRRSRRNLERNDDLARLVTVREDFLGDATSVHPHATTLDTLVAAGEIPAPDLVKVDVDGGEVAVLHGARETLGARGPDVIVEVHSPDLERDCGDLLTDLGYRVTVVTPRKHLAQPRPAAHNRWIAATRG